MPTIDSIHLYPQAKEYWDLVKKSLHGIFHVNPTRTDALVDTLRKNITTWPAQEQLLFYHAEPLNIAADLVGERPTETQTQDYIKLATADGWYTSWLPPQPPTP